MILLYDREIVPDPANPKTIHRKYSNLDVKDWNGSDSVKSAEREILLWVPVTEGNRTEFDLAADITI